MAIVAIAAPKLRLPKSPIKTRAGCELKTKNPSKEPTNTKQNIATSSLPSIQAAFQDRIPKARKAITDNPAHNPSSPSVIFTALLVPTKIKRMNKPKVHPKGTVKCRKVISIVGSPPFFINI